MNKILTNMFQTKKIKGWTEKTIKAWFVGSIVYQNGQIIELRQFIMQRDLMTNHADKRTFASAIRTKNTKTLSIRQSKRYALNCKLIRVTILSMIYFFEVITDNSIATSLLLQHLINSLPLQLNHIMLICQNKNKVAQ